MKALERKLAAIADGSYTGDDFLLADAKDADMAFGIGAPGRSPESHPGEARYRTLAEYREQIRQIVRQGAVDIMLMSASTSDLLTIRERMFAGSAITPAVRANDTTDIWVVRGGTYVESPSRPYRTATLDHIQCGHVDCEPGQRQRGADLGLYSLTFNNRLEEDQRSIEEYREFREEAERRGFRHFLEVFDPNAPQGLDADSIPRFVNDAIARTLAGVAQAGRPLFLKIVYHGPAALEELVAYDPHLVVGILGGSAGTTYDAFKLLAEAKKYGARVALFGRKINSAESQLAFVQFLRLVADGQLSAEEAVPAYHAVLQKLGIKPHRRLADDMQLQSGVMSYGGRAMVSVPGVSLGLGVAPRMAPAKEAAKSAAKKADCGCHASGAAEQPCACPSPTAPPAQTPPVSRRSAEPTREELTRMTTAEKLAYNQAKRRRVFGW